MFNHQVGRLNGKIQPANRQWNILIKTWSNKISKGLTILESTQSHSRQESTDDPPVATLSLLGSHEWGGGCLFFSEAAYQQVLTKSILCLNYVTSLSDIEIDLGMFALQKNHCQQRWIDGNMMKYLWNIWNWQGWWIGFIHAPRQAPFRTWSSALVRLWECFQYRCFTSQRFPSAKQVAWGAPSSLPELPSLVV